MHGILLAELERYVDAKYGDATWHALLDEANLRGKRFSADAIYADADLVAIVRAVPTITPVPLAVLEEDFGAFLAPALLARVATHLPTGARALDVVERAGELYVEALAEPAATATIRAERTTSGCVVHYTSPRRLCSLVRGVLRGTGVHLGETLAIEERACMRNGAPACEIVVRST